MAKRPAAGALEEIFMNNPPPLIQIDSLSVILCNGQARLPVVRDVSLSLAVGTTLGLVGESGCGKSMLARAIMRILPRDAVVGADTVVSFEGRDLLRLPRDQMRRLRGRDIAMIFQNPMTTLNPVLTVGRQITEVLRHHRHMDRRAARRQAVALLERVGLPMAERRAAQYPHQLSGGMRQRVAIAIALACEPKLLIADEPTTALDVTVQAEILSLLARLQRDRRMAMILITHDLAVVAGCTDQTAVMYAGRIVEQAPTETLFKSMRMPYTRALMAAIPRLDDRSSVRLKGIDGHPPHPGALPAGCGFAPRCRHARSRCRRIAPPLVPLAANGHRCACWFPLEDHVG